MFGNGVVAARLPMLMIRPQPFARICGISAWINRTAEITLPLSVSSHASGFAESQLCSMNGPAFVDEDLDAPHPGALRNLCCLARPSEVAEHDLHRRTLGAQLVSP